MAPSRNRNAAVPRPPATVPSRLHDASRQPTITIDTGTPTKPLIPRDRTGTSPSSSSSVSTVPSRKQSAESLRSKSKQPPYTAAPPNGPRSSIDDDNGDGDPDLLSPNNTSSGLNLPASGILHDEDVDEDVEEDVGISDDYDDGDDVIDDEDEDREHGETPSGLHGGAGGKVNPAILQRRSSTPLPMQAPPNAFAPPFYNRPPTPLPPSPSLTSLLRPSFSSRPTTPDDSESEVAANGTAGEHSATEAAVAKSARDARTVPRASPKVPTYEYYGFVLYLTSGLVFLMYILWSYLPSPFLHQLGIYYYPDRWWSLAVPAFLVMLLVYIYIALAAYNIEYLTPPLGSMTNVVDDAANVAVIVPRAGKRLPQAGTAGIGGRATKTSRDGSARADGSASVVEHAVVWQDVWNEGTDAVMDVPVGGVCEILYGEG